MLIKTVLSLLAVVIVVGLSAKFLVTESASDSAQEIDTSLSTKREILLDPETGEMMTDAEKISEMMNKVEKTNDGEKGKTFESEEMEGGAVKLDLGKAYIKPRSVTINEHGQLESVDHVVDGHVINDHADSDHHTDGDLETTQENQ